MQRIGTCYNDEHQQANEPARAVVLLNIKGIYIMKENRHNTFEEKPLFKRKINELLSSIIVFIIGLIITVISFNVETENQSMALYSGLFIMITSCSYIAKVKISLRRKQLNLDSNDNQQMEL